MGSPEEYQALLAIAEEEAHRHGSEVIELVVRGDRTRRVIELFMDSEAGISLGQCQEISKAMMLKIDAGALEVGNYRLDVSSPGIDRPLKFPWQYKKHTGRNVEVICDDGDGKRTVTGKLVSVDAEGVVVQPGKGEAERRIPFGSIVTATIKTPW